MKYFCLFACFLNFTQETEEREGADMPVKFILPTASGAKISIVIMESYVFCDLLDNSLISNEW